MEFDIYSRSELIPIFTMYDDHDLGKNNSDVSHPYIQIMKDMFRSFFPIDNRLKAFKQGPGSSYIFELSGMQVCMTDSRYFKNPAKSILLGAEQTSWIKNNFESNPLPKLLISTQQFWKYEKFTESYQRQANAEFNNLISFLKNLNLPILFVSGDVHYSQIQQIDSNWLGYQGLEITSSAFFSSSAGNRRKTSIEEGQLGYYGKPNFLILDKIAANQKQLDFRITCVSEISKNQFSNILSIKV